MKNINKVSEEELSRLLVQGEEDINRLNLAKATHRKAFMLAITSRPNLLGKVNPENEEQFFTYAVKENYANFLYLKKSQYTNELAQIYLYNRLIGKKEKTSLAEKLNLTEEKDLNKSAKFVQKSLDERLVFNYSYVTPEGEELYYLDPELQVPTSIKSSLKIVLKLIDAIQLIETLDLSVGELGEQKIRNVISDTVNKNYRAYLNDYISKNNIGYYTLCTSFAQIEEGFVEYLGEIFKRYGIEVKEVVIKKIAIPKDVQYKIEDQAFAIRQRRADIEADGEFAKLSLENYAEKLAVEQKYPNATPSLTEYEKDLALKRYLIKTGHNKEEEIDRSIKLTQKAEQADQALDKQKDVEPDLKPKKNLFAALYYAFVVLATIIVLSVMPADLGSGLICLGAFTAIFGVIAAFFHKKLGKQKVESDKEGGKGNNE